MNNFNFYKSIDELKNDWETKKLLTFDNLFNENDINSIYDFYNNQPDEFWEVAVYPDKDIYFRSHYYGGSENIYPMYITREGDPKIDEKVKFVKSLNDQGLFSYYYKRSNEFHPYLRNILSQDFFNLISDITGYKDFSIDENFLFVSSYESNHYNGTHIDGVNGRIAFVFHMTKDWSPSDGGLFLRLDEQDTKKVTDVVVPSFNKLVMFDVKDSKAGTPHLVSEVSSGCTKKRISFTGWLQ